MIKNYFYGDKILDKISEILDRELPKEVANVISVGDFSVLPSPDELDDFLPAVLISIDSQHIIDGNEALGIYTHLNNISIYYITPYDFNKFESIPFKSMNNSKKIANTLMNFPTLEGFKIDPSDNEVGGQILWGAVDKVNHNTIETEFFRQIKIPAYVEKIEYSVMFKNYRGRV